MTATASLARSSSRVNVRPGWTSPPFTSTHGAHDPLHPNGCAQNRQGRPPLVAAQRIERDADAFEQAAHVSCRRAAMGSSRAARLAGYTPATTPTPAPSTTPTKIDQGATAAGTG